MVWLWSDGLYEGTQDVGQIRKLVTSDGTNRNPVKTSRKGRSSCTELKINCSRKIRVKKTCSSGHLKNLCSFVSLPESSSRPRSEPMGFFQGIKLVMGHGPYAKLVMVFLFTSLGFMVSIETHTRRFNNGLGYCASVLRLFFGEWIQPNHNSQVCAPSHSLLSACDVGARRVCMFVCLGSRIWLSECLCSRPAAPGGKLRPVLQLHAGLQKWLPEHSAGHHGESTHTQEAFSDTQTFRLFPWCRHISLSVWTRSLCGISLAISSEYRQKLPSQGEHINCLQLQACSVLG